MRNSFLFVLLTLSGQVQAQTATPSRVELPRASAYKISADQAPIIDGQLDEAVWRAATRIVDFHQTRPDDHGIPTEKTEAQIAIDAKFVYVAFRNYDTEMDKLVAKGLIQGQNFFSDDRVAVNLDTFNDRRNSYFFQVNANGMRRDSLLGNNYFIDEWDTIWYAATAKHDWGWTAEMAIPIKSIAFDPGSSTWGMNLTRISPRRGEELAWSSIDRNANPSAFGYLEDASGFTQGLGLEFVPSVSLSYLDNSDPDNGLTGSDTRFEPSLTTFYNVTPYLTAGVTLNTDFSGTDVDERQVNLSRFSLFFPEKREFFLRDASIFEFGDLERNARPFFSRRIGLSSKGAPLDIDAGFKLSGRAGAWNVGALGIKQKTELDGADDALFVGRASRNIMEESEFGFIATHGDPTSLNGNSLVGTDFTYRNSQVFGDKQFSATAWYQQSETDGLVDNQRAYGGGVSYPNYKYSGYLDYRVVEENFNPALGFVNRSGVTQVDGQIRYRHRLSGEFWQWLRARAQYFRSDRIDGGVQTESIVFNVLEGFSSRNDFFTFWYEQEKEGLIEDFQLTDDIVVPAGLYTSDRVGTFFETGRARNFRAEVEISDGDFLGGSNLRIQPTLEWRPNKHFFASVSATENRIELPQGRFTSRLYSARLNYAINSQWAWLNVIQADNFSDTVSLNSRLRYQPRADREYLLIFDQTRDRVSDDILNSAVILKLAFNFRM
ncbi:MAG: carbohydrate binding family 9 domain-containing protein [Gammaproteobacteria bacterium]|nr:carbohydrate binding family 9 domain-containing protein [Gammaproteobacteria bacterium]